MIKTAVAPIQAANPSSPVGVAPSGRSGTCYSHEAVCSAVDISKSMLTQPSVEKGTMGDSPKPPAMSKVRVLRREESASRPGSTPNTAPSTPGAEGNNKPSTSIVLAHNTDCQGSTVSDRDSATGCTPAAAAAVVVSSAATIGQAPAAMTDTTNPALDLHQFIVTTVNQPKDRMFMLATEHTILQRLSSNQLAIPFNVATATSYHRMLVHRIGAYFGMDHTTDPNETGVTLQRTARTRLPERRFIDLVENKPKTSGTSSNNDASLDMGAAVTVSASPVTILRREDPAASGLNSSSGSQSQQSASAGGEDKKMKTMEEREAEYEEHRKRIFSQYPAISTVGESTANVSTTSTPPVTTTTLTSSEREPVAAVDSDYNRKAVRTPRRPEVVPVSSAYTAPFQRADGIWRAAGPGALQTEGSATSRPSSSADADSLRHRFDRVSVGPGVNGVGSIGAHHAGNTSRHSNRQTRTNGNNGGGGGGPNKQQNLGQLSNQSLQRWVATGSANGSSRGLMPLPGQYAVGIPQQGYLSNVAAMPGLVNGGPAAYVAQNAVAGGGYVSPSSSHLNVAMGSVPASAAPGMSGRGTQAALSQSTSLPSQQSGKDANHRGSRNTHRRSLTNRPNGSSQTTRHLNNANPAQQQLQQQQQQQQQQAQPIIPGAANVGLSTHGYAPYSTATGAAAVAGGTGGGVCNGTDLASAQFYLADNGSSAAAASANASAMTSTVPAGMVAPAGGIVTPTPLYLSYLQQQQQQQQQAVALSMACMGTHPVAFPVIQPTPSQMPLSDIAVYEVFDLKPQVDVLSDLRSRMGEVHVVDNTVFAIFQQDIGRRVATELQGPQSKYRIRLSPTQKVVLLFQRLTAQNQIPLPAVGVPGTATN